MGTVTPLEANWVRQQPSAFDIVAAYYPESNPKGAIRLRPCLVLNVFKAKHSGQIACQVAYGTKHLKFEQRKRVDVIIQSAKDLQDIGLAMATRFNLDAPVTLPWNEDFFGCWSGYSHPKIGRVPEHYIRDYAYCMMVRKALTDSN